jgi:predicted dehydrogenase
VSTSQTPAAANGIANVTASRISCDGPGKRFFRQTRIPSTIVPRRKSRYLRREEGARPEIEGGRLDVPREEPLKRELADFVAAILERRPPQVTGQDGRRALALAQLITERMRG